jgi:hypothetical protein
MTYAAVCRCIMIDGRQSETALLIARGVRRYLRQLGLATVTELILPDGRRADIVALAGDGTIHIVEIKSSIADFRSDSKWTDYRAHCDRLSFAVTQNMPLDIMPQDAGLIVADAYGAEVLREAPSHRMSGATRRAMLLRFAHAAANRLHVQDDPDAGLLS